MCALSLKEETFVERREGAERIGLWRFVILSSCDRIYGLYLAVSPASNFRLSTSVGFGARGGLLPSVMVTTIERASPWIASGGTGSE
jgi:hypothetical protein